MDDAVGEPPLRAAQRADLRRPRRGPDDPHRRRGAAGHHRRHDRAGGGLHQHPVPPAGRARRSSPRTGTPRRPSPASRSRSAPTRRSSSAGSCGARPASRSSSRPPTPGPRRSRRRGYARGCGSANAGSPSVFDLFEENVRYFPALLPICDAGGPGRDPGGRRHPGPGRAAPAQRHHLPVEPADLRRRAQPAAPAGGEPGAARRPDRAWTPSPTARSTSARPHARRVGPSTVVADVVQRRRGELPRAAPGTASTRRCSGRAWATCRSPSWCCAGCCRWPTRAWTAGASPRPTATGCMKIIEQRCLTRPQRRDLAGRHAATTSRTGPTWTGARRCARCVKRYVPLMHSNDPVHEWPLP